MKTQKQFAVKLESGFYHFFSNSWLTASCAGKEEVICLVEITEDSVGDYWTWYNKEDNDFQFTAPFKQAVDMCFAYGYEADEKRGRGKLIQVFVKEIREIEKHERRFPGITADEKIVEK